MLSNGRARERNYALAVFLIGVCTLAFVGAFVIVLDLVRWAT